MLSNLLVKSNLIECFRDEVLVRLSAMDLSSISKDNPRMGNFFDQRTRFMGMRKVPTQVQNAQWTARLFWGEQTVSLQDDGRASVSVHNLANEVIKEWSTARSKLDIETAKEWLWLCAQIKIHKSQHFTECQQVEKEIRDYLVSRERYDEVSIDELINALNP